MKQNKQLETPVSEIKAIARRNGAVIKTFIDRTCTHIVCSEYQRSEKALFTLNLIYKDPKITNLTVFDDDIFKVLRSCEIRTSNKLSNRV